MLLEPAVTVEVLINEDQNHLIRALVAVLITKVIEEIKETTISGIETMTIPTGKKTNQDLTGIKTTIEIHPVTTETHTITETTETHTIIETTEIHIATTEILSERKEIQKTKENFSPVPTGNLTRITISVVRAITTIHGGIKMIGTTGTITPTVVHAS